MGKLLFNSCRILFQGIQRQQLAHFGFARGISDHASAASDQGNGSVALLLHVRQGHDRQQAANMQTGCGRIKADIAGHASLLQAVS